MTIQEIRLDRVRIPLEKPYRTALGVFTELDAIVGEIRDADGRSGIGETTIIPHYTPETVEGGWRFCRAQAEAMLGRTTAEAKRGLDPYRASDPHAASVFQVALEMIEDNPILRPPPAAIRVPILAPVNSKRLEEIPDEIERLLADGFRTLKIKVGWDVDADLRRVSSIQERNAGRASLRVDANQGYDRAQATRFASSLDPADIQLFEQPCAADDWAGNAAVAAVSRVPVMLDESIYGFEDIDRAAAIKGCGFVKLKISKMTGVDLLIEGLNRIRRRGMAPVLGNGAASDIGCWIEACVGAVANDRAGEMHGFLKNTERLFARRLRFSDGAIVLEPGFRPELDRNVLDRLATAQERFAARRVTATF